MKRIVYILPIVLMLFTQVLSSQEVDLSTFEFRNVGPIRGGRVTTVTGVPSQPHIYYMGATGGGVWKTEDYGSSWKNISDGYFMTPSIGAIRVSASDSTVVYVGTGSDGLRSNVITGKGVYKSSDSGKTWEHKGLKNVGQIGAIEIHPNDPNTVFVAAIGQAFQTNNERGVFRSKDGGDNWEHVLFLSDSTGIVDLEFHPTESNVIYAAAWRAERKPWTIISGVGEDGIYKSLDGGTTWKEVGEGLPAQMGKIDLAVSKDEPNTVYALIESTEKEAGLYKSNDKGNSFKHVSKKFELLDRPFYYCNVDVDPNDANNVFVASTRMHTSSNGGKTWEMMRTPHGDNHDIWINPNNSSLMVQANDGGANVSLNGGKSWSNQFGQNTAELYQVEVDNAYPYWLYAGQQDNYTAISVPSLPPYSTQAGASAYIKDVGGCETGPAVPNPEDPNTVYSNCKGRFYVHNKISGQNKSYDVGAYYMYGHNTKDLPDRFQRVSPIHISPHDAGVIYHCSQYVYKTTNEGQSWERISDDLTAFEADKQMRSGSPFTNDITGEEFYSTIYSIQESKKQAGVIWIGSNDGLIHVTTDGAKTWKNVTPSPLKKGGRVDSVEPSVHDAKKAFVTFLRYQLGDWQPYIFKTTNSGMDWELVTKGIPTDYPVRVLREDPEQEGLLYAGTEFGLFVSFDDGANWQSFQNNLPIVPITDIKIHRGDLVMSTMGRGFWILDDITTLRQSFNTVNATTLFKPADAVRYRYGRINDMYKVSPSPKYPRPGMNIDYYLNGDSDFVGIKIISSDGRTVRAYTNKEMSVTVPEKRDMATNNANYIYSPKIKSSKGHHRIRWDFRNEGAWQKDKKKSKSGGPYVASGAYTIVLQVDDVKHSVDFELKTDPRVTASGVSDDDIQAQEKLSLEIVDLISKSNRIVNRHTRSMAAETDKTSISYKQLLEVEQAMVRKNGRYTQPMFISQLEYLLGIVNRADQRPGQDVYDRFDALKKEFTSITGE